MVAASPISMRHRKTKAVGIPTVDLSVHNKSEVSRLIVNACQELGFFKVINHGVPKDVIAGMKDEGTRFFAKTMMEKREAGPARPFGFGCRNIGVNGDMGELEYLLLHTNPLDISERSQSINSNDPTKFSCTVNNYVDAVRGLACEILDLAAEGLWVPDKFVFSRLIRDVHSDSVLRLNHYPPAVNTVKEWDPSPSNIGFGEHSDPQILTILTSNDVAGLQICFQDGLWVPVPPDPTSFYVIVGDALQALTNGRFVSIRHRALANSPRQRLSLMYFGAPPLNSWISPLSEMVSSQNPSLYKPFTWGDFKNAVYSLRLGDTRLDLFKNIAT